MILNAELFVKIAEALISEYARVYSVNLSTNEYRRYLINENTELSDKGQHGSDFLEICLTMWYQWCMKRINIFFRMVI